MKHTRVFRDGNHLEILHDLRKLHYSCCDLAAVGSSCPDLVVANSQGNTALIEIKMPDGVGRFYLSQLRFLATWKGYAGFASSTDEARNIVDYPEQYSLTPLQREIILEIVAEDLADVGRRGRASLGKEQITIKKFEKIFATKIAERNTR